MVVLPEDSWFMVQRGDRHFKCLGSELRNFIQLGDKFLMQRDDIKHAITVDWLPTPSKDSIKPPDPPAGAVPPDPNITVPDFTFGISYFRFLVSSSGNLGAGSAELLSTWRGVRTRGVPDTDSPTPPEKGRAVAGDSLVLTAAWPAKNSPFFCEPPNLSFSF